MTVRRCLCKEQLKPGMLIYRHVPGGTTIGEVKRVNEHSVRIRKLNEACTCMSDDYETLKFKPSRNDVQHAASRRTTFICWCVTDVHELTPEVAQEKYFRDMLVGCNPYIAKKIGWTERMSAVTQSNVMTAQKIDELNRTAPSYVPKEQTTDSASLVLSDLFVGELVYVKVPSGHGLACVVAELSRKYGKFRSVEQNILGREFLITHHDLDRNFTITKLRSHHCAQLSINDEVHNIMLSGGDRLPCDVLMRIVNASSGKLAERSLSSAEKEGEPPRPDVTDLINAGKYRSLSVTQQRRALQEDLELSHDAAHAVTGTSARQKLDAAFSLAWKHAYAGTYGLHDVVYWYNELWPLVAL